MVRVFKTIAKCYHKVDPEIMGSIQQALIQNWVVEYPNVGGVIDAIDFLCTGKSMVPMVFHLKL